MRSLNRPRAGVPILPALAVLLVGGGCAGLLGAPADGATVAWRSAAAIGPSPVRYDVKDAVRDERGMLHLHLVVRNEGAAPLRLDVNQLLVTLPGGELRAPYAAVWGALWPAPRTVAAGATEEVRLAFAVGESASAALTTFGLWLGDEAVPPSLILLTRGNGGTR